MRLVYLSPVPWESFSQRPHKFVEWFHNRTGGSVLWVDPYPTRLPAWRDFQRARLLASINKRSSIPLWLTVLKPGGLPIEPIPASAHINGLLWREHLREINRYAKGKKTLLAIGKPSVLALELFKLLRHCPSLYDAMDDFPAFYTGLSRFALVRTEREIARRANIILVSSSELKSRWMHVHHDVRLVHNGLDFLATRSADSVKAPSKHKIFGYVGTIAPWFDWDWICALAEARPNDEIRLIGPIFEKSVRKLPANVNLLPACARAAALNAMSQFDVGLIPFHKNALTASVDPIKYYEYRALGLPIISTAFGEMSLRTDEPGVFVSQSANDVATLAESAIEFNSDAGETHAFAVKNTWEARFDAAKLLP